MKIKTYLIIGVALIAFTSCEDVLNNLGATFESDYYTYQMIVPPSKAGDTLSQSVDIKSDFNDVLKQKGYANDSVQDVYLTDVQIDVNDQSMVTNLDAIKSVKISMSSDSYPEKVVAEKENNLKSATQLPLTLPQVNIANYLKEVSYKVNLQGIIGQDMNSILVINVKIKYKVDLKLAVSQQ